MNEPVITIPRLAAIPWLIHGFGTRRFGAADLRAAAARRKAEVVLLRQVHSDIVLVVARKPAERPIGDGLITSTPGLILAVKTADCLPIFLIDAKRRAVGAVHAGWRGTAQRIAAKAVGDLRKNFKSDPADLLAVLGPSIGPACYEVGEDVREAFLSVGLPPAPFAAIRGRPGRFLLDLAAANAAELRAAGLRPRRILRRLGCTHCDPGLYSFRRDCDTRRRLYNFIGILAG